MASYMKLVYRSFHKDNVSDETIKADLEHISDGALKLDANTAIETVSTFSANNFNQNRNKNKKNKNKNKFNRFKKKRY